MHRVLFICSRNRLRSPTAEQIFSGRNGIETDSGGLAPDADSPVTPDQVQWADVIFVMEKSHKARLGKRFRAQLNGKRMVCLDIPDNYTFMQPELVALLEKKVAPHLR
ncbi:low molecular weight protein tyrosine phosphatase family protein [uncultured Ramlibacter sp.]|uniref:low molecular weight protein tyrosine phosphatase family protein n=1 Tax=uncultured Ramlibacter sp. TaxID=260755 RepID=UPI002608CFBD|nr:low molecular weight protein tyrosine phosphatase family protein [uncultured Ramlibacter sp.]